MVAENQEKLVMTKQRKNYSPEFKAKLALAAIRGEQSMNQLSTLYGVHPNQIGIWKKQAQEAVKTAFNGQTVREAKADEELTIPLPKLGRFASKFGLIRSYAVGISE
jgi:transposase